MVSTAQNMSITLEDAISFMHEELKSVIPNLADASRANPNGPKKKLSFTNLLRVNDEAVDLEPQILENFVSKIRNKFKNFLRPRTSLVESFKLVEATEKKEDLSNGSSNMRDMSCLHQYHEECITNWLEYMHQYHEE
ncbi:hypothetical protein AMTRI_Chr04g252040 [Amborella trichopoda]